MEPGTFAYSAGTTLALLGALALVIPIVGLFAVAVFGDDKSRGHNLTLFKYICIVDAIGMIIIGVAGIVLLISTI